MNKENEVEILLVEDNETDAELTIRALRKRNFANHLKWVKDGAEALDYIFNKDVIRSPKVILLDLRLPKVDGIEVLQKLKSDERTKLIPVVILTSSKEDIDIISSYKYGVNSYINKPVEFDKFAETVSELGLYWLLFNNSPVK